jgi:hypothetical protein
MPQIIYGADLSRVDVVFVEKPSVKGAKRIELLVDKAMQLIVSVRLPVFPRTRGMPNRLRA